MVISTALRVGCLSLATLLGVGAALAQGKGDGAPTPSFRDERRWSPAKPVEPQNAPLATASPTTTTTPAASAIAPVPTKAAATASSGDPRMRKLGDAPCGAASLRTTALEGGRMAISIASGCRGGQEIAWSYGGGEFATHFETNGQAEITVDCFAGMSSEVEIKLADGTHYALPVEARDLDRVSKIAVLWRSPATLQLHAFEYAAIRGELGHVNATATSSFAEAREAVDKGARGRGFMSSLALREATADKLEVYTFLHKDGQTAGLVTTAVDYASRGGDPHDQTCGKGQLAELPFRLFTLSRKGVPSRENGVVAAAECGQPLADAARFNVTALPVLRIRN